VDRVLHLKGPIPSAPAGVLGIRLCPWSRWKGALAMASFGEALSCGLDQPGHRPGAAGMASVTDLDLSST
jgi:hypothetical protein